MLELVVLAFTVTVCAVLILVAIAVTVAGVVPPNDPAADRYLIVLVSATSTLLGALLGLLAGRTTSADDTQVRPSR